MIFRRCLLLLGLLSVLPLGAQTMIDEYALQGTLTDNLGGPSLSSLGGTITGSGYTFGPNQGLTLANPAMSTTTYSIELVLSLTTVSGYRKILDFNHLGADAGFYNLNGQLNFYPVATGTPVDFVSGNSVTIALTRDGATNAMAGYVNGVQRFTFTDSSLYGVLGGSPLLNILVDDFNTSQGEASGGTLTSLRIFNGALSSTQVNALYLSGPAAVPEPATYALLAGGLGVVAWRRRQFRR
jgi:hypothetical protein